MRQNKSWLISGENDCSHFSLFTQQKVKKVMEMIETVEIFNTSKFLFLKKLKSILIYKQQPNIF